MLRTIDGKVSDKPLLKVNVSNGFFQGMLGIANGHSNKNSNTTSSSSGNRPLSVFLFYTEDKGNGNLTNTAYDILKVLGKDADFLLLIITKTESK